MEKVINRLGEKHITNEGYKITIVEYTNSSNATIQFKNGLIIKGLQYSNIKRGKIKNPTHISVQGVGYIGIGRYSEGKHSKIHDRWNKMLYRSYCEKYHRTRPTYKNVIVCSEWHNFQNFAAWYEENYREGWQLDKDILIKGNKIYSPETCCFVPPYINTVLISCNSKRGKYPIGVTKTKYGFEVFLSKNNGIRDRVGFYKTVEEAFQAYKVAKESYIKEVADKWKSLIKTNVYEALCNYQVEITD